MIKVNWIPRITIQLSWREKPLLNTTSCQQAPTEKSAKTHAFKGKRTQFRQNPGQATVFPKYKPGFPWCSGWVIHLFRTGSCTSRIWGIVISVPLTWRHLYVARVTCVSIFSITELQKTIRTREVLLTELSNWLQRNLETQSNYLSQMHKRCKTGFPIFFQCHGRTFSSKTFIYIFLYIFPLCLLSSTKLLPYLLHSWLNNKWSTFDYIEIFQDPL